MTAGRAGRPMGRPPLAPEGRKGKVLIVRVTAEEKAVIEAAAERASANVSEWVRCSLLAAASDTQHE